MKINLRMEKGWSEVVQNKGVHGKTNCDVCGSRLFIGPGNIKYCDALHTQEEVNSLK